MSTQRKGSRHSGRGRERRIRVRGIRRDPPDLQKFSRAIVALALAQAEADAEAEASKRDNPTSTNDEPAELPSDESEAGHGR